jgi:hypothetical protein
MAVIGILSIYLGYRLFCDSAYQRSRFRHLASGALLAVLGLGILIADVRSLRSADRGSAPAVQKKSTAEGSFQTPKLNKHVNVAEHFV